MSQYLISTTSADLRVVTCCLQVTTLLCYVDFVHDQLSPVRSFATGVFSGANADMQLSPCRRRVDACKTALTSEYSDVLHRHVESQGGYTYVQQALMHGEETVQMSDRLIHSDRHLGTI